MIHRDMAEYFDHISALLTVYINHSDSHSWTFTLQLVIQWLNAYPEVFLLDLAWTPDKSEKTDQLNKGKCGVYAGHIRFFLCHLNLSKILYPV